MNRSQLLSARSFLFPFAIVILLLATTLLWDVSSARSQAVSPVANISPQVSCSQMSLNQAGLTLDRRELLGDEILCSALAGLLLSKPPQLFVGTSYAVASTMAYEEWTLISLYVLEHGPDGPTVGETANVLSRSLYGGQHWRLGLEGTPEFSELLREAPTGWIPEANKAYLDPLHPRFGELSTNTTEYKFPWPAGDWQYWNGFNHDEYGLTAIDVGWSQSPNAERRVLAAAGGVVNFICDNPVNESANVKIVHDDGKVLEYWHIDRSTLRDAIRAGQRVERGRVLGSIKGGTWNWDGCGTTGQNANSAHLHWILPSDAITVDGWTIDYPDSTWRRNDESRSPDYPYDLLTSTNTPNEGGDPPPGEKVKLYRKPNFQEERFSFGTGFSNDPEGELYSMKVPSGWSVWTFREDNKGGQKRCWSGDVANFQDHEDWQSKIQSIDVKNYNDCPSPPEEKVKLYRKPNFQEERFSFGTGFSNDPEGELYSMKVPSGWSVWTFREDNKGGQKRCWSGDVANFQDHEDWQSKIQSIDVKNYNDCPPPAPTANFDVWPPSGLVPLAVTFHDTSQGNYTTCLWEYGDGTSSTTCGGSGSYHDRVYSNPGTYSPKLTVTGPGGSHSKTLENPIVVQAGTPPAPTLISPSNGATIVEGSEIVLSWNSTANANEYYGQINGGPNPMTFDWQSGTSKNIGVQWPGYTYSWKVKARNGSGESGYSNAWSFTVIPKTPSNVTATPLSCTWVKVTWTDNSASEDGYKVYRNDQEIGTVPAGGTSVTDQGAEANRSYTYTVKAYRHGIFSNAGSASATTPDCPVQPPQSPVLIAPTNGKVFVEGETIILSWNSSANATGYYGAVLDGPAPISFGWQSALEKNLGSLTPGYRYSWKVKARNDGGESDYSAVRTFDVVPAAPTNLVATAESCTSVRLTWWDNSIGEDGYKIYRNGTEVGSVGSSGTMYTDGVLPKTTYNYTVKAHRNGFFSNAGSASVTTPDCSVPPPAPPVLVSPSNNAKIVEGESIVLTWNSVTNATGYFGNITGGPAPLTFGWQTGISKNIGSQSPGYEYFWEVKARNGSVEGNFSNKWVFIVIPKAPSNLSASLQSCSSVNLTWTDNSGSEDGYKIYRNGTEVGLVGAGGSSYTDQGLQEQTSYSYVVRAHRNGLHSNPSNSASITTSSCNGDTTAPQVVWVEPVGNTEGYNVSGETVTLKVNATDNVAVDFVVFSRWDHPTQQIIEIGMDFQAPYTAQVDTSEFTNDWNEIRAQAIDSAGNASDRPYIWLYYQPDDGLGTPPINAINNADGDGNYIVDWPQINDATGYKLQEQYDSGSWSQVYNGPNTSVDRANRSDGEWCYRLRAYNDSDQSDWSAVECVTVNPDFEPPLAPVLDGIGNAGQQSSYWVTWGTADNADSYELQERYSSGSFSQVYSGPSTSHYVFGQGEGQWCYRVRANGPGGQSGWSQIQCTMVDLDTGVHKSFIPMVTD